MHIKKAVKYYQAIRPVLNRIFYSDGIQKIFQENQQIPKAMLRIQIGPHLFENTQADEVSKLKEFSLLRKNRDTRP